MTARFSILQVLGVGAQSAVCVAVDRQRDRRVALKVVRQLERHNKQTLDRVKDEGRILAQLKHPNIPRVLESLEYDGIPVLVMEYAQGIALSTVMRHLDNQALPVPIATAIAQDVARALDYAWNTPGRDGEPMRVVHRDVKPDNILIDDQGKIRLMDFGIATGSFEGRAAKSLFLVHSTQGYEAPERRQGVDDDDKVDVYGLGATLLEFVSGHTPVFSKKPAHHDAGVKQHLDQVQAGQDTERLCALLRSMLSFDAGSRPSMHEVAEHLGGFEKAGPSTLRNFAVEPVRALIGQRDAHAPQDHEAWDDLAMLQEHGPSSRLPALTVWEASKALTKLLSEPDWEQRIGEVQGIQDRAPFFLTSPLVDVLDRAAPTWYRFWQRPARPGELEQALVLLCDHSNPTIRKRAKSLRSHPDSRVVAAAAFVLSHTGREDHED